MGCSYGPVPIIPDINHKISPVYSSVQMPHLIGDCFDPLITKNRLVAAWFGCATIVLSGAIGVGARDCTIRIGSAQSRVRPHAGRLQSQGVRP